MFRRQHLLFPLAASVIVVTAALSAQTQGRRPQPARDTSALPPDDPTPAAKGRITGRVLTADTGRPVRRARVFINAAEVPGGRGLLTDDNGVFEFAGLPAGRYTVMVSKTGFISLSYGQRRPLQAGTPLQLVDGQQLAGIDFSLPRGSVMAGHVMDESGDPLPGATIQVMRYQYGQGNRQLVPAGGGQTDDQGAFRVWGLNPGDYYVSAVTRSLDLGGRGAPGRAGAGGPPVGGSGPVVFGGPGGGRGGNLASVQLDAEPVGYAPTFYPGVASVSEARPITVGLSAEVGDINFGLLLVRTSRISGRVTNPDGSPTTAGSVNLIPDGGPGGRSGLGRPLGSRVQWDGAFSIANIPPGRYTLQARGDDTAVPQFAAQPVTVAAADTNDLTVVLSPGGTISGTVTFQSTTAAAVPDFNQVRIAAPLTDFINVGPNPTARVNKDGTFTMEGISTGQHWIRTQGALRGWMLKSVTFAGREIIDIPLDVRSGQALSGLTVVFTDKLSEVSGTLTDERDQPITEFTVLAFPTDAALWRPQARQIITARPDQNGKYQLRGLPAGDYFLATVDPGEQGEWFEPSFLNQHRTGAARMTLGDGDVKTQDFKLTLR
jgi:hypothetical protein